MPKTQPSSLTTLIALLRRLAFTLLTKLLQLVLPLPLFPAISSTLAQAFNLPVLPALPSLQLPSLQLPSLAPPSLAPRAIIHKERAALQGLETEVAKGIGAVEETMPLAEKVRSWRAFQHDGHGNWGGKDGQTGGGGRPRIEEVEFLEGQGGKMGSVVKEAKKTLEGIVPKVSFIPQTPPLSCVSIFVIFY